MIFHGAQLNIRDDWGQTPLMHSVNTQLPEIVQILLEADSDLVHCVDRFCKSSLHLAVDTGNVEVTQILLQFGADVNIRCDEGMTPLMNCCNNDPYSQRLGILRLLLDAGALIDLTDYKYKRTALHFSVMCGCEKAVQMLLGAGAALDALDKGHRTPLTQALLFGFRRLQVKDNYSAIVTLLVSSGADVNLRTTEDCNPLLQATRYKSEVMVNYFLSLGVDPNVRFHSGVTPALAASSTGDISCLKALLRHNCDLTLQGSVYKRRLQVEVLLDSFEMAYTQGFLSLCLLMAHAGYPLHSKASVLQADFLATSDEGWAPKSSSLLSRLTPQESENNLTMTRAQHLDKDFRESLQRLLVMSMSVRSLRDSATMSVRKCLVSGVVAAVEELPLPRVIKNAVLLKDLLN